MSDATVRLISRTLGSRRSDGADVQSAGVSDSVVMKGLSARPGTRFADLAVKAGAASCLDSGRYEIVSFGSQIP